MVAPMLFHTLDDRRLAGAIAGEMFSVLNYIGLVCGTLLLVSVIAGAARPWLRIWQIWVLAAMLLLTGIGEFILQPMMQALKAAAPQGFTPDSTAAARFGMLHGVSSTLFLATSLLGLVLVIFGLKTSKE